MKVWRNFKAWCRLQVLGPSNVSGWYITRVPYKVTIRTDDGRIHIAKFYKDFLNDSRMPEVSIVEGRIRFTSAEQHANNYARRIRQQGFLAELAENHEITFHYPASRITVIVVEPDTED